MIHSTINSGNFLDFLHFKYPAGLSFPCLKHLETEYWGKSGWVHKCTLHKCTLLLSLSGLTASLRGTLPFLSILSRLRNPHETRHPKPVRKVHLGTLLLRNNIVKYFPCPCHVLPWSGWGTSFCFFPSGDSASFPFHFQIQNPHETRHLPTGRTGSPLST